MSTETIASTLAMPVAVSTRAMTSARRWRQW
jgi:hypothetical protein